MKKLSKSQFAQISIMLFGLFFGAGNLIFPPFLGNQAGNLTLFALLSFCITAVIFPVLGAIAVGKSDGLSKLANRVGSIFSIIFTTAIYMSIGPGLGIPRAGSVPFEMAIAPYIPESFNLSLTRLLYTAVFFGIALWICLNPSKLVKRVGKYLTPALLLMIVVMYIRIALLPKDIAGAVGNYKDNAISTGFLAGYDTMDAVAALNFGYVISTAVKNFGVKDKDTVTKYTIQAGLVAGSVLFLVYYMLSSIGSRTSGIFSGAENGAVVLSNAMKMAFGDFGLVFLALIFTLACLTTCVGLITSGGEYFHELFNKKLSYRKWVVIWTGFSFVMANFGLNNLLKFSVPLLTVIYPVALVLIVMGVSDDHLNYSKASYVNGAFVSVILPFVSMLSSSLNVNLPVLSKLEASLPMADKGLSWLLPTIFVIVLTEVVSKVLVSLREKEELSQRA